MRRIHYVNAFSGVVQVSANIALTFLIVPIFIRKLGLPTYGIYALISAIGQVGVFTNFGFNTTVIKYLGEQSDRQESNYDMAVTFVVIGAAAITLAALSLIFRDFVLFRILGLSFTNVNSSVYVFYVSCVATNVFAVLSQIPSAVLDSQQKVYVTNTIQFGVGVAGKILILISLLVLPNLGLIGLILMTSSASALILFLILARRTWGQFTLPSLRTQFLRIARKHFTYGRSVYATTLTGFFYEPITKVLLNHYLGLAEVGFFDIALKIKNIVLSLSERMLYPVLPLFAKQRDLRDSRNLHDEVQGKLAVIVIPSIIAMAFMAKSMVSLWLGARLWPVIIGVVCIVSCFSFAQLFVPLYQFLLVKGHPEKTFAMQIVNVTVNTVAFIVCVPLIGYYGALLAFCAAILSSIGLSIWYQWSVFRTRPIAPREFGYRIAKLTGGLLIANVLTVLAVTKDWPQIISLAALNGTMTIVLFRYLKLITQDDIQRYVGRNNLAGEVLEKVFVPGASHT